MKVIVHFGIHKSKKPDSVILYLLLAKSIVLFCPLTKVRFTVYLDSQFQLRAIKVNHIPPDTILPAESYPIHLPPF